MNDDAHVRALIEEAKPGLEAIKASVIILNHKNKTYQKHFIKKCCQTKTARNIQKTTRTMPVCRTAWGEANIKAANMMLKAKGGRDKLLDDDPSKAAS